MAEEKVINNAGWNDPPSLSYNANENRVKRPSLNKRVGHILNEAVTNSSKAYCNEEPSSKSGPPPTTLLMSIDVSKSSIQNNTCNEPEPINLTTVMENYSMDELYFLKDEKEIHDIKRRLTLMEKMWKDGKLPFEVKQKLNAISTALCDNNLTACDDLQRSLMVDYPSLCSSWIAAIRILINSKRANIEKPSET